ncbi:MAG: hypothetical protein H7A37_01375 [Chlamydiales bacterium]|nr:hypothetical protein [Chlamydiia bacterium]MCP5506945.1 hypothetical protein [Chlamydiales bacterium]
MHHYFSDYYWKNGKPYGRKRVEQTDESLAKLVEYGFSSNFLTQKGRSSKQADGSLRGQTRVETENLRKNAPNHFASGSKEEAFRIVIDPYFKRITVEVYEKGCFKRLAYDSALFDFRRLTPVAQNAWRKEMLDESVYLIRDEDDRVIIKEVYTFDGDRCRECRAYYPYDILVSVQKMYYQDLGDPFNGVVLYDREGRPVTMKEYSVDTDSGEFRELIQEHRENVDEQVDRLLCRV